MDGLARRLLMRRAGRAGALGADESLELLDGRTHLLDALALLVKLHSILRILFSA